MVAPVVNQNPSGRLGVMKVVNSVVRQAGVVKLSFGQVGLPTNLLR